MIKRYKKKPIVIEAIQYTRKNTEECVKFCGKDFICFNDNEILIKTLEEQYKALLGDYIIKGIKGEVYPCKPEIFEMTYEEV